VIKVALVEPALLGRSIDRAATDQHRAPVARRPGEADTDVSQDPAIPLGEVPHLRAGTAHRHALAARGLPDASQPVSLPTRLVRLTGWDVGLEVAHLAPHRAEAKVGESCPDLGLSGTLQARIGCTPTGEPDNPDRGSAAPHLGIPLHISPSPPDATARALARTGGATTSDSRRQAGALPCRVRDTQGQGVDVRAELGEGRGTALRADSLASPQRPHEPVVGDSKCRGLRSLLHYLPGGPPQPAGLRSRRP